MPSSSTPSHSATTSAPEEAPIILPEDAGIIDVRNSYGARGDGVSDDTAALQRAISENVGKGRTLYLPPGTYLVTDTLLWRDLEGNWQPYLTLQGAGRDRTIIKLVDHAAGFEDPEDPKPVVMTGSGLFSGQPHAGGKDYLELGEGNEAFRNYLFDLTVDSGSGNPGAVGVDLLANNNGGLVDVTLRSGDGAGVAGLSMTRKWPGPALLKNVSIHGFDLGVTVEWTEYGLTFENLELRDQRVAGIRNDGNVVAIHNLRSENQAPAIENIDPAGLVVVVEAELVGGASHQTAIHNDGFLYARSVTTEGYRAAIEGMSPGTIDEYAHPVTLNPFSPSEGSLGLPIRPTPEITWEDPDTWASVTNPAFSGGADPTDERDDTAAIQAALDSGQDTVYLPASGARSEGRYLIGDTLVIPPTVRRIVGMHSMLMPTGRFGDDQAKPLFRLVGDDSSTLTVVERLVIARSDGRVFPTAFRHEGPGELVLRHVTVSAEIGLDAAARSGPISIEDYCCASITLARDSQVWARQLDLEAGGLKLDNRGGTLWILGLKTEQPSTVIRTSENGETELLGGLLYPVRPVPAGTPAFVTATSGHQSLVYAVSAYVERSRNYGIQIREQESGEVLIDQVPSRNLGSAIPLYRGP